MGRVSLLEEELSEARQEQESRALKPFASAEEEKRIRANIEAKYQAKIAELNDKMLTIEKERADIEDLLTRKLQQKGLELETLKRQVDATSHTQEKSDSKVSVLKRENSELHQQIASLSSRLSSLEVYEESFREQEVGLLVICYLRSPLTLFQGACSISPCRGCCAGAELSVGDKFRERTGDPTSCTE